MKKKLIQMGFDPMTHQPRTDLFSSLPQLLVLANLRDLLEHHSLDEHALRLQTEAVQLARLQFLNHLLQSPAASTSTTHNENYTHNNIPNADHDHFNLLNSIISPPSYITENPIDLKETKSDSFCVEYDTKSIQPLHHTSQLLSHAVDPPQVPFSFQPSLNSGGTTALGEASKYFNTMVSEGDNPPPHDDHDHDSPWMSLPCINLPNLTDIVDSNKGDGSSSSCASSYGSGRTASNSYSYWPADLLLDDSLMHEISKF